MNNIKKNIIYKIFKVSPWIYGECSGKIARKHVLNENVQFILWRKGDQKYIDGIGHKSHVWYDFHESHWINFEKY